MYYVLTFGYNNNGHRVKRFKIPSNRVTPVLLTSCLLLSLEKPCILFSYERYDYILYEIDKEVTCFYDIQQALKFI